MLTITPIPAFKDNYIWALSHNDSVVVVDPGDASPVLDYLQQQRKNLKAIMCTHRHADHIGGIAELREVYNVPVYGRSHPKNPHITHDLREGDNFFLDELNIGFTIWEIPGHLDDHLAFVAPDLVFCGDVLFGAGCGKNFEGESRQLHHSLQRLSNLPDETLAYCAHEYTISNLRFALICEPQNQAIQQRMQQATQLRDAGIPTVPFTIGLEKATNPFLRCTQPEIIQTLQTRGIKNTSEDEIFNALREWRDHF
jgi:hydroxyacylglutathione hydrolase